MLMTFQSFVALEIVALLSRPKLDGHILRTACHVLSVGVEVDIVNHASVLSQSLFAFTCFVVPNLDGGILTGRSQLRVNRMERYFCNF